MDKQFLLELQDYIYIHIENELNSVEDCEYINYTLMDECSLQETYEVPELPCAKKAQNLAPTAMPCFQKAITPSRIQPDIEEYIRNKKNEETFSSKLLKYIDLAGLPDSEVYKKAGIDRRHFSKIRCDKDYQPKKLTVVALSLALELQLEQVEELLKLAGYSLTNSDTGDLIVKFCIEKGRYDLMEVNEALEYFGMKAMGVVG